MNRREQTGQRNRADCNRRTGANMRNLVFFFSREFFFFFFTRRGGAGAGEASESLSPLSPAFGPSVKKTEDGTLVLGYSEHL